MSDINGREHLALEKGDVNGDIGFGVSVTMSEERARLLFYDISRLLGLAADMELMKNDRAVIARMEGFISRLEKEVL